MSEKECKFYNQDKTCSLGFSCCYELKVDYCCEIYQIQQENKQLTALKAENEELKELVYIRNQSERNIEELINRTINTFSHDELAGMYHIVANRSEIFMRENKDLKADLTAKDKEIERLKDGLIAIQNNKDCVCSLYDTCEPQRMAWRILNGGAESE